MNIKQSFWKRWYRLIYRFAATGSTAWLVGTEMRFGGKVNRVPFNKISPHDSRSLAELRRKGMGCYGGDRMLHNAYAKHYARYLAQHLDREEITLAEVGILKGTGLAIWCELFPNARVIGFDIDLTHTQENIPNLKARGAFQRNQPELHEFDQLVDNTELLGRILKQTKIDVYIDDGLHTQPAILTALASVKPFLSADFVCFIEDNKDVHVQIRKRHPEFRVDNHGDLTVIRPPSG